MSPNEIIEKIKSIISLYNEQRMANFDNNKTAARHYLISKLTEEFGEYCEVAGMNVFLTDRKAKKYNLLDTSHEIDISKVHTFISDGLYKESGDLVWMALSLAFLEGHTIESLASYLDTRKDAANKTYKSEA